MKYTKNALFGISRNIMLSMLGLLIVSFLMLYQLVTITPGLSSREIDVYNSANSLSMISSDLVNAPYKLAVLISTKVFTPELGLRLVGAIIGIVSIMLFYLLISNLYSKFIGIATASMFASSSLLLSVTRMATPAVMLLVLLSIISCAVYVRFGKKQDIAWLISTFVIGLSLYTPGILLFLIPVVIWQYKRLKTRFIELDKNTRILSILIILVLVAPLLIGIATRPATLLELLGFSKHIEPIITMVKYAGVAVASISVISPADSAYWLGRQPILDVFATAMLVLGAFSLIVQHKLSRFWLVAGIALLAILWIGLTTNRYSIVILLPFIYLVIGSGIELIYTRWQEIFPRNPLAQFLGTSLLVIAIFFSINFQLRRYFVAWPSTISTVETFSEHL